MSLQGTLETFAVPDVLSLLAATRKTGELRVDGERSRGRLWLDGGQVVGADVARAATFADAVFELLRLSGGSFVFDAGATPPRPADPVAVDTLLAEAQSRLGEWRAIEAVVSSLACPVRLAPELQGAEATVSAAQWKALVAVATGGDVAGVMERLKLGEFDACRTVKELVDSGLVKVERAQPTDLRPEPAGERPPVPAPSPARAAAPAPEAPAPVAATPAPSPDAPVAPRRPAGPQRTPARPAPRAAADPAETSPARRPAAGPDRQVLTGPAPSLEEAEELVSQLASLRSAPPRPDAERPAEPAGTAAGENDDNGGEDEDASTARETPAEVGSDAGGAAPAAANGRPDEEPINRGMLLKFLSSVRS